MPPLMYTPIQPASVSIQVSWNLSDNRQLSWAVNKIMSSSDWQIVSNYDFDDDDFGLVDEYELEPRVFRWEAGNFPKASEDLDIEYSL